ncbi:MAG: helix-turn-helix transcriptional regulator [Lachnospiraceae bacterium]|nr:helix-turn-helix transcriptional regulator [Lachnospiraceae bacterium]
MSVDYKDLGSRIKKKRENLGMSQAELADLTDLSTQHISNVENARSKIGLDKLVTVANVLNCSIDELLCGSMRVSRAVYSEEIAAIIDTFTDEEVRALPEALKYFNYINGISMRVAEEKYKMQ